MKVCVVGTIVYDHIFAFKGEEIKAWGGIFYNIIGFANIFDKESNIYPVSKVGEGHLRELNNILAPYKNIDTTGITISPEGTNEDLTHYVTRDRRIETTKLRIKPIKYQDVEEYLNADVILFNFISGVDIPLDTIREVRERSKAIIFMDVHNKAFGIDTDGQRFPRPWKEWKEWLCYADIVQMNEEECGLIMGKELTQINEFTAAAIEIIKAGPSQILITLGNKGALIVYKKQKDYYHAVIPITSHKLIDTTGCGDSFSAGYITSIIKDQTPILATVFANVVAGQNCEFAGFMKIKDKNVFEKRMLSEFPEIIEKINQGWKGEICGTEKEYVTEGIKQ